MWTAGTAIFLHVPSDSGERTLHPGSVREVVDGHCIAEFEEEGLQFERGQEVWVYGELHRQFVKLPGQVAEILEEEPLRLSLHLVGEAAAADQRQQYRVCTVLMDKVAVVGDEPACPLLDMSIGGFAIMSERDYKIGDLLPVTVSDDEREFSGIARVQSVREMHAGAVRYGFLCVDEREAPGSLKQGLRELTMAYQREQLARQAVHN